MPAPSGWWKFTVTGTTGLMQNNEVVFSSPFPNPAKAITCVPFYLSQAGFIKAELLDMHGRVVQVLHEGRMSSGEQRIFVDASTLADGIYMVRFNGTNNNVRLMVAH
jgi:hypothetical protein